MGQGRQCRGHFAESAAPRQRVKSSTCRKSNASSQSNQFRHVVYSIQAQAHLPGRAEVRQGQAQSVLRRVPRQHVTVNQTERVFFQLVPNLLRVLGGQTQRGAAQVTVQIGLGERRGQGSVHGDLGGKLLGASGGRCRT